MFEDKTYDNIKNFILENYNLNLAKMEGSFLNDIASASALNHANFYVVLENILNTAFIKDSFGENLDKRVAEFGVVRKKGERSAGFVTIRGKDGVVINHDVIFSYAGRNFFVVEDTHEIIITDGAATVFIEAENTGEEYNLDQNVLFNFNIEGIDRVSEFTLVKRGTNDESDDELKRRFFYLQRHKGTSGNVDDYINWALEVDGVKNVKVLPLWNGNGTVKVIVMTDNNRNVSEDVVSSAQEYIDSKKPIGASVTVVTPTVVEINISATVEYSKNADKEYIKDSMRKISDRYLIDATEEVTYTKLMGILSSIDGVIDFKDFMVNKGIRNIKLGKEQIGSIGSIVFSEGVVD